MKSIVGKGISLTPSFPSSCLFVLCWPFLVKDIYSSKGDKSLLFKSVQIQIQILSTRLALVSSSSSSLLLGYCWSTCIIYHPKKDRSILRDSFSVFTPCSVSLAFVEGITKSGKGKGGKKLLLPIH